MVKFILFGCIHSGDREPPRQASIGIQNTGLLYYIMLQLGLSLPVIPYEIVVYVTEDISHISLQDKFSCDKVTISLLNTRTGRNLKYEGSKLYFSSPWYISECNTFFDLKWSPFGVAILTCLPLSSN